MMTFYFLYWEWQCFISSSISQDFILYEYVQQYVEFPISGNNRCYPERSFHSLILEELEPLYYVCPSVYLSLCRSSCLSIVSLAVFLSVHLSVCLSVCLSRLRSADWKTKFGSTFLSQWVRSCLLFTTVVTTIHNGMIINASFDDHKYIAHYNLKIQSRRRLIPKW